MIEPIIYLSISFVFSGLIVWAVMSLVHRRAARLAVARLEAAVPGQTFQADRDQLHTDPAPSHRDMEAITEQLKDRIATQTTELNKNIEIIAQLKTDRDLLKIEHDALHIQMGQNRDIMKRLEADRDKLKNEVDALHIQKIESDKKNDRIKQLEIEHDDLKKQINALKNLGRASQKMKAIAKLEPTTSPAIGPGPKFLPLDATQRAQFPNIETNEKDSQKDDDHRAAG